MTSISFSHTVPDWPLAPFPSLFTVSPLSQGLKVWKSFFSESFSIKDPVSSLPVRNICMDVEDFLVTLQTLAESKFCSVFWHDVIPCLHYSMQVAVTLTSKVLVLERLVTNQRASGSPSCPVLPPLQQRHEHLITCVKSPPARHTYSGPRINPAMFFFFLHLLLLLLLLI